VAFSPPASFFCPGFSGDGIGRAEATRWPGLSPPAINPGDLAPKAMADINRRLGHGLMIRPAAQGIAPVELDAYARFPDSPVLADRSAPSQLLMGNGNGPVAWVFTWQSAAQLRTYRFEPISKEPVTRAPPRQNQGHSQMFRSTYAV
jgi:hypothetical protein